MTRIMMTVEAVFDQVFNIQCLRGRGPTECVVGSVNIQGIVTADEI